MGRRRRYYDSSPLRLDTLNKKIGGVCSGVANYFGWSHCTVRILAIIGLFIMPHIVLPAYGLAYLVLDEDNAEEYYEA